VSRELSAKRDIDLAASFAYSDSETDIPMLLTVGHAYAVNPDKVLTRMAHEREWPILSFTHPVRAHDRSKSHTPFLVSAVVIGIAAVLGRSQLYRR